jgi:hypothetical protein
MAKKKKDKRTNNDLQNTTHKTKYRAMRTPLKTGGELMSTDDIRLNTRNTGQTGTLHYRNS